MPPLGPNPAETGQLLAHPHSERRRHVRHKLHMPAYIALNPTPYQAAELSEIIDLNEDGMAIQTSSPLEIGCERNLSLDLAEDGSPVETAGTVVWSDASGRAGIRFIELPPESIQALKKWLYADALAGSAQAADEARAANEPDLRQENERDHTSVLTALVAVRREVELLGPDLDAALQLIARRAQAFTRASAAAIGLTEGGEMICRATAGPNAPAVGTRLRVGSGFSGECVRSGILLRCDDSENDTRVDRESCRALDIRSMIAAPVRSQGTVIGLMEVFSPQQKGFQPGHELVLQRLTEIVSAAVVRASLPEPDFSRAAGVSVDDEFPMETPADLPILQFYRPRNFLLAGLAMSAALALLWASQPWVMQHWVTQYWSANTRGEGGAVAAARPDAASTAPPADKMDSLQKLAASGDPVAQFDLGVRYWTGDQVGQDYGQAVRWFSLAAERGNVAAQAMLGNCYWAGRGVPADPMRAYFWSFLAQAAGDEASKSRVEMLASRLTPGQIAVTRKEAQDWMALHSAKGPTATR